LRETDEWASKLGQLPAAAIYNGGDRYNFPPMLPYDLDGFHDAAASRDNVFCYYELVPFVDFKAPAQNKAVIFLLREDVGQAKVPCYFMPHNDASQSGRNHAGGAGCARFVGEASAHIGSKGRVLQEKGALEKLAAVKSRAQKEVSFEQRSGLAEKI